MPLAWSHRRPSALPRAGLTHKGGILSESSAAVAGGVTSFMDMPNVKPATTTRELLAQKYALAAGKAYANYAFYLGASNTNIDEIKHITNWRHMRRKGFHGVFYRQHAG